MRMADDGGMCGMLRAAVEQRFQPTYWAVKE
jgi:hypothetical protein